MQIKLRRKEESLNLPDTENSMGTRKFSNRQLLDAFFTDSLFKIAKKSGNVDQHDKTAKTEQKLLQSLLELVKKIK